MDNEWLGFEPTIAGDGKDRSTICATDQKLFSICYHQIEQIMFMFLDNSLVSTPSSFIL